MRRRAVIVSLGVIAAALGLWSACNDYDDATLIPEPDAATSDVAPTTDVVSTSSSGGADSAPNDDGSVSPVDASSDAGVDACAKPCDCDGDGYLRFGCGAVPPDAAMVDCDDNDKLRHPGQGFLDDLPSNGSAGDWNCDGKVEKGFNESFACSGLAGNCTMSPPNGAFKTPVGCGQVGELYTCVSGLNCVPTLVDTKKQLCR